MNIFSSSFITVKQVTLNVYVLTVIYPYEEKFNQANCMLLIYLYKHWIRNDKYECGKCKVIVFNTMQFLQITVTNAVMYVMC
jgi:hypothetical protein